MKTLCMAALLSLTTSLLVAQELPKPSKEHELLAQNLGDRAGKMKIWVQGPDADPVEVPFTETNKKILGGFWVLTTFTAGPYQGSGMSGYDPVKKKYVGTWANNMHPFIAMQEGTFDEKTKELTMTFKDYDQLTGKLADHKTVTTFTKPGAPESMTMYKRDAESSKFVKSFVMTYDARDQEE